MILNRINLNYFCYVFIFYFLLKGITIDAQSLNPDDIANKVIKKITVEVSEGNLEIYEKFTRKLIKSLKIDNANKEEIDYLIKSISQYLSEINETTKDANNTSTISIEIKDALESERKRLSNKSLKDCYQLWIKNKEILKKNFSFIRETTKQYFTENSAVILDSKMNNSIYKEIEAENKKVELKDKTKLFLLDYIHSNFEIELKLREKKIDSLFYFGKESLILDEKNTSEVIQTYLKDIFFIDEGFLFIGDVSDVNFAISRTLIGCLDNVTFEKISKNTRQISLKIYLKKLQREFKNKPNFIPVHYGKEIDFDLITNAVAKKINLVVSKKSMTEEEYNKLNLENRLKMESWEYFSQFLHTWGSGLIKNIKFISPEELSFVLENIEVWREEYKPYYGRNEAKITVAIKEYEILTNYLDEIFLFDKNYLMINIQDEFQLIERDRMYKTLQLKRKKHKVEYLVQPEIENRYNLFNQKLKQWLQENYIDKLSPQDIKDIPIRKQARILFSFQMSDIENNYNKEYTEEQFKEMNRLYFNSIQKLYDLKLITGGVIEDAKLKDMKLTKIEYAIFDYFKKTLDKNPIFSYTNFDSATLTDIQGKYSSYRKELAQENEKNAYELVVKILLEESLKKISK